MASSSSEPFFILGASPCRHPRPRRYQQRKLQFSFSPAFDIVPRGRICTFPLPSFASALFFPFLSIHPWSNQYLR
ncbi:hypothetical protein BYT27DRAFT_6469131 [Phlegmacium glaucopus]|nr:hypothetical protein BYT27DRAFT_6469131 [Phlegmacium glaucopus]